MNYRMYNLNLTKTFLSIIAAILFVIISCKKTHTLPKEEPVNNSPGQFTISLVSRSWDTAKIMWTKSIDPDNDSVSYKVYLNDTLKIQNYTSLNFTFKNLNENTSYVVKVVAIDSKLKETTATLNFTTKIYFLKFLKKVEYGPITGYSLQKTGQMIKANDGGYIIVGDSQLDDWPNGPINTFALKIDSLGNKIWQKRYNYNSGNSFQIKIVSYSGGYVICGGKNLIRINNNGDLIWHQQANLPSEEINGIAKSSDGSIYTVGYVPNGLPSIFEATLGKYDPNGNLIWKRTYSRAIREAFYDIKISNNEIIVLGKTNSPNADFWVIKLSMDGNIIWDKVFIATGYAFPENIIKTSEGNYVFTGHTSANTSYLYLQMIDANGNNLWTYFTTDNHTRGYSVAETNDNSLIVTGAFELTYYALFALYKFNKNGNMLWEKLYEEFPAFLFNKTVIPTSDGGYLINCQKSKAYNTNPETDQIYIFKTDNLGEFY